MSQLLDVQARTADLVFAALLQVNGILSEACFEVCGSFRRLGHWPSSFGLLI
jgi:hypothetical protein